MTRKHIELTSLLLTILILKRCELLGTQVNPDYDGASIVLRLNPIRWRGKYYDLELGLYYMNSRWYDPRTGRFINSDDPIILPFLSHFYTSGVNLFMYAANNPVMYIDETGFVPTRNRLGSNWGNPNFVPSEPSFSGQTPWNILNPETNTVGGGVAHRHPVGRNGRHNVSFLYGEVTTGAGQFPFFQAEASVARMDFWFN